MRWRMTSRVLRGMALSCGLALVGTLSDGRLLAQLPTPCPGASFNNFFRASFDWTGGSGKGPFFGVGAGCAGYLSASAPGWLHVRLGASTNLTYPAYEAEINTGGDRSGTVTYRAHNGDYQYTGTFEVSQTACPFPPGSTASLGTASYIVGAKSQELSIPVGGTCDLSGTSDEGWVQVRSTPGNRNALGANVLLVIQENWTESVRTANVVIGGAHVVVIQNQDDGLAEFSNGIRYPRVPRWKGGLGGYSKQRG